MCKEKSRSQGVGWGARRKEGKKEEEKARVKSVSEGRRKITNEAGPPVGRSVKRETSKTGVGGGTKHKHKHQKTDNETKKLKRGPTYRMFPSETGTVVDYAQASQTWS